MIFEKIRVQNVECDENYKKIYILEEHNKYIPFLINQFNDKMGLYITDDYKLDVTSKKFREDYRRHYISDILDLRDKKLADTDWTRLDDINMDNLTSNAWKEYRQKLRDLPENIEYGENVDILPVTWPQLQTTQTDLQTTRTDLQTTQTDLQTTRTQLEMTTLKLLNTEARLGMIEQTMTSILSKLNV
jgi:hypothetical protein